MFLEEVVAKLDLKDNSFYFLTANRVSSLDQSVSRNIINLNTNFSSATHSYEKKNTTFQFMLFLFPLMYYSNVIIQNH